jgi:hypothetical protein
VGEEGARKSQRGKPKGLSVVPTPEEEAEHQALEDALLAALEEDQALLDPTFHHEPSTRFPEGEELRRIQQDVQKVRPLLLLPHRA